MQTNEIVKRVLMFRPETRENDNLLYHYCLMEMFGTSDTKEIADITNANVFETISRVRRKVQSSNPLLKSSPATQVARGNKEKEVREWARQSI